MAEIIVEAKTEKLEEINAFIEEQLEGTSCSMATLMKIELSIEELFVNIANYAYFPVDGMAKLEIELLDSPERVKCVLYDRGKPFDPLAKKDPDITIPAEDKPIGGLGVFLVKKNMDEYYYEYKDEMNIMTIIKELN